MKLSLLQFALPLAALSLLAPASAFAQAGKGKGDSTPPSGATVIPGGEHGASYVISQSGSYVLGGNRTMTVAQDAIVISAADVTLDLAGFTLGFASAEGGLGRGVSVTTAVNVEIRNGSISNVPSFAIYTDDAAGSGLRILDLRIADTAGISSKAANTRVENSQIADSRFSAIMIGGAGAMVKNCQVTNVTFGRGIQVSGTAAAVVGNIVSGTHLDGIRVHSTAGFGGMVSENVVADANQSGTADNGGIHAGPRLSVRNNHVYRAVGHGIVAHSGASIFEGNNVCSTVKYPNGTGGHAFYTPNSILRNNAGVANASGLLGFSVSDAGGNVGF